MPKTLNSSTSLNQKARNVPASVADRIVQRGASSNRGACRLDVGAAGDERGGYVDVIAARCPVQWGLRVRATRDWGVGVGTPADEQINYCRTIGKYPGQSAATCSGVCVPLLRWSLTAANSGCSSRRRVSASMSPPRIALTSATARTSLLDKVRIFLHRPRGYIGLSHYLTTIACQHFGAFETGAEANGGRFHVRLSLQ